MKLKIDKKIVSYPKQDEREKLTSLIINNRGLLNLIDSINIIQGIVGEEGDYISDNVWEIVLEEIRITRQIDESTLMDFKVLWAGMDATKKGHVLEQLVSKLGAYHYDNTDKYSNSSRVYLVEKEGVEYSIKYENNFDVIFCFSEYSVECGRNKLWIDTQQGIEFHEAKKNINNELPADEQGRIKSSMQKKLDFIKEVNSYYPEGKYYIPTFSTQVKRSQDCLIAKGYGFVEIISIKRLIEKYA